MLPPNRSSQSYRDAFSHMRPSMAFIGMIFIALIAFEIFNYSTTDHALSDLLGDLTFIGLPWSTLLAVAFCGIDFAGIARLFTPEQGMDEPKEVWYLFGAWLLAATMNALLTWWGVSLAVAGHPIKSGSVVDPATITGIVPVFVAIMVWVIRILIIGTLSLSLDHMLHPGQEQRPVIENAFTHSTAQTPAPRPTRAQQPNQMQIPQSLGSAAIPQRTPMPRTAQPNAARPSRFSASAPVDDSESISEPGYHPEPTYHSLNSPRPGVNNNTARR